MLGTLPQQHIHLHVMEALDQPELWDNSILFYFHFLLHCSNPTLPSSITKCYFRQISSNEIMSRVIPALDSWTLENLMNNLFQNLTSFPGNKARSLLSFLNLSHIQFQTSYLPLSPGSDRAGKDEWIPSAWRSWLSYPFARAFEHRACWEA